MFKNDIRKNIQTYYVDLPNTGSIIDTTTNTVTATVGLGGNYCIAFGQLIGPSSASEPATPVADSSTNDTEEIEQTANTTTLSEEDEEALPSASVSLHGEKTDVVYGEDILLKLSAVNLITKPTMHVQVIIIPPSGMTISSSEFVQSGAGQYTTTYELEPGQGKDIEVRIAANQVGDYNVKGRVVYYFGDEIESAEDYTLNLPIQVKPKADPQPTQNSTSNPIPGFGAARLVFILMTTFILKRKVI